MSLVSKFLVCFGGLVLAGQSAALTTLDTSTSADWNGSQHAYYFGSPDATATYGQVITVPYSDTRLTDFTFFVDLPTTLKFRGAVYAWDSTNQRATGLSLFESVPRSTLTLGMQPQKFVLTAPVTLTAGKQYVLFISASKDGDTAGKGFVGYTGGDRYGGGAFYSLISSNTPSLWTTAAWSPYTCDPDPSCPPGNDLAFIANFDGDPAAVTMPSLNGVMLIALAGLTAVAGALSLRRRRA